MTLPARAVEEEHWNFRVFCAVAEQQSVSRAAHQLAMTQSGVSMVVRRLAKRYGARLLDQRGRGVVLTEAGVELYRHALSTLRSAYDLEARIRALDVGKGLVILATRQVLSAHFLPLILVEFWSQHPGVEVRVRDVVPRLVILRDVFAEGVDFAVLPRGGGMVFGPSLAVEPVHREPLVIIAAPDHPLAQEATPALEAIARQRFVVSAPETGQVRRLEALFRPTGLTRLDIAMETSGDGAKELVRAGVGLSLVMRCSVRHEIERGELGVVPLPDGGPAAELVLVHQRDEPPNGESRELMEAIREAGNLRRGSVGLKPELETTGN